MRGIPCSRKRELNLIFSFHDNLELCPVNPALQSVKSSTYLDPTMKVCTYFCTAPSLHCFLSRRGVAANTNLNFTSKNEPFKCSCCATAPWRTPYNIPIPINSEYASVSEFLKHTYKSISQIRNNNIHLSTLC